MKSQLRTIRPLWLAVVVLLGAVAGWLVSMLLRRFGLPTPALPYSSLITLGLVILVVVVLGLRVRSWRNGNRDRSLDPIMAARTLVLAQASAYAGALLFGWHLGVLIDGLIVISYGASAGVLALPAALLGGSALMVAAGLMTERFCRVPPEDGGDSAKGPRGEEGRADGEEFAR